MVKIFWTNEVYLTYDAELDFINKKWSVKELIDFDKLVDNFINTLKTGTLRGKQFLNTNIYSFVISKQTTVYYRVYDLGLKIDILLFWNNKRNPKLLEKFLKSKT